MDHTDTEPPSLEYFAGLVPEALLGRSGEVFYSGRAAFSGKSDVYLLGYNPGSDPADPRLNNVGTNIVKVCRQEDERFSSYYQSWEEGRDQKMQKGIKSLFSNTGLDPCQTPSSNCVFVRSREIAGMDRGERYELEMACWPFHEAVISLLEVKLILCMGGEAFRVVSDRIRVFRQIDEFVEENNRRWTSQAYETDGGIVIVKLTHPSRASWYFRSTDPSPLVRRMLDRVRTSACL